jgi:hypothetical protein
MNTCTMYDHVDRHFAGTISPNAERDLRGHLLTCEVCRLRYRRRLLLASLDPSAPSPEERIARGLGVRARRPGFAPQAWSAVAVAAAAAVLLLLRPATHSFTARGNIGTLPQPPTSRVFVYEIAPGQRPMAAGDTLRSGAEVAFSYENGAAKRRLVIFGVDEHGHVYWFHPAWTNEGDDPVAIPIEGDARRHELPEAIRQRFDGTRLEIRSVFVDDPLSVRQVEALLRQNPRGALPVPGAVESSVSLTVVP